MTYKQLKTLLLTASLLADVATSFTPKTSPLKRPLDAAAALTGFTYWSLRVFDLTQPKN